MMVRLNDTELFYQVEGRGIPVLMMHGIGFDHTMFQPWFDRLADQVQLIYYDHRGNGRSARPSSMTGIDHETWIADADALRAELGHERIVVFGHSYGGFLAQEYALRYGDHLAGLVLCSTAPVIDYADVIMANAAARASAAQLEAVQAALGRTMRDDAEWQAIWRVILPLYFERYDPAVGALLDQRMRYSAAAYNHANGFCLPAFNTLPSLHRIQAPTLILNGAADWITPIDWGVGRLHQGIPGSRYEIFERSGHFPFIEEDTRFFAILRSWLAGLQWTGAAARA